MKKLLALFLVLGLLVTAAFAYEDVVKVNVSGTGYFNAYLDEEGIDLEGGISDLSVSISPSSGSVTAPATITAEFSIDVLGTDASLSKIAVTTDLFDLTYYNSDIYGDGYVFYYVGDRALEFTPKLGLEGISLTAYFADIVSETDLTNATNDTNNYFDDAVALKLGVTNLDLLDATLFGAFYDTDTNNATSAYGYAAHLNLTGKDILENLVVDLAYAYEATSMYLVEAQYSKSFEMEPVTLTVSPYFVYSEGAPTYYTAPWGSKLVKVGLKAEAGVTDEVTFSAELTPTYDLDANSFSLPVTLALAYDSDMAEANVSASWDDAVASATNVTIDANLTVTAVENLTVKAAAQYKVATNELGYNVDASYVYGPLTTGFFFGTLFDSNSDGTADINDYFTWYLYLKASVAF
ncbi:MAG: Uncharacterized protein XD57_0687 [Thermotoga petrophila]|uniref:Uncharacterized protein n=1 Tax=Thermotoga petrophila TaxID=93929 RepID=A0A101ER35_9THEM|nr:MAG: Uncharacterized protein XD57_0687 [Thermotoga petrophila]HBU00320.1 hypothetical protein [Thermotoga petrophila]